MSLFAYIIIPILLFIHFAQSQVTCGTATTRTECESCNNPCLQQLCTWHLASTTCRCKSEVKQDIYFGVDISGSIGWTDFQKEKAFLNELASQGIGAQTKMGFNIFSSTTNKSRQLDFWPDTGLLQDYVNGIRWTGGFTFTRGYLQDAIDEFAARGQTDRSKMAMLITDGVPCQSGWCPADVCDFATALNNANIRVVVVGVGSGWTRTINGVTGSKRMECIADVDDIYEVAWNDFDTLLSALSDVVCPINKAFKITEIKTFDDSTSKGNRFVEVYNDGVAFDVSELTFDGIIKGTPTQMTTVGSGQYVVFYDAVSTYSSISDVTCQKCLNETQGGACILELCTGGESSIPPCYCNNSIYIPCGASSGQQGGHGCYFDTTNNAAARTNWFIEASNNQGTAYVIDRVDWTSSWITVENGFPYELVSKTADNDLAGNWRQACHPWGTPGTDPQLDCPDDCTTSSCTVSGGSNTCNTNTGDCDCVNGYYPSGRSCLPVPVVDGNCTVIWYKNSTTGRQEAYYQWTKAQSSIPVQYSITYFDLGVGGYVTKDTFATFFETIDIHSRMANTSYPAYITTSIKVNGVTYRNNITRLWCELIKTSPPSPFPTENPSNPPVFSPTAIPTMRPTYACPKLWMTDICTNDRCEACKQTPARPLGDATCCILPEGDDGRDPLCDDYEGDQQRPKEINSDDGTISIAVRVYDEFPFITWANWTLELVEITPGKSFKDNNGKKGGTPAPTPAFTLADVGIAIEPMMGNVSINGTEPTSTTNSAPKDIGFIRFKINPLNCTGCNDTLSEEELKKKDCDPKKCFDGWKAKFTLKLLRRDDPLRDECWTSNANNPQCCEIIYPWTYTFDMSRNAAQIVAPPNEDELPPWIWWLIAALVVFLLLLAFLVYKFWWKAKKAGQALDTTQKDLDAAVAEAEMGFGADLGAGNIGFNPLAHGATNVVAPNSNVPNPNVNNQGIHNQKADVRIEKFNYKQEYGAQMGK